MTPVCPKCDEPLVILVFKDTELDYCALCRGLWLDAGELEEIMGLNPASSRDPILDLLNRVGRLPEGVSYLCPRCDEPMTQITAQSPGHKALTLERCATGHGFWFDADELEQLLAMCDSGNGSGRVLELIRDFFGAHHSPQPKTTEIQQGEKPI